MIKKDCFASSFVYVPIFLALCLIVDETASHGLPSPYQLLSHLQSTFYPHNSPGPQIWPNPFFSPSPSLYYRPIDPYCQSHPAGQNSRYQSVPLAHGHFDPYYSHEPYGSPNHPHDRFGPHKSPPDFYHRPYHDVRRHDPFYHHRLRSAVETLHLDEGDFCRRGHGLYPDYVCVKAKNCSEPLGKSFRNNNRLDICSFDGIESIVCCPTSSGKTPVSSHPNTSNSKNLAKPPAHLVQPPIDETATKDVDRILTTTPFDLIQPPLEEITVSGGDYIAPDVNDTAEPLTAPETDQNSDAFSTSENFPSESPIDNSHRTGTETMIPIVVIQSPSVDENTFIPDSANDDILSDTLAATQSSTEISATDSATNDQNIEKIFSEKKPEVFRPPIKETEMDNIATRKCRQYTTVDYPKDINTRDKITKVADSFRSYPHMAMIGYGKTVEDKNEWKCGGSLISERWILTAGHCYKIGSLAQWVRLGIEYNHSILDIRSSENDFRTQDYQIIKHVLHPSYRISKRYNDIALFYLEKDVEFSAYVRPICLNSDPLLNPSKSISTSWGKTLTGGRQSDFLLETTLDIMPENKCKQSYDSINDPKVRFGIQSDSMICASSRYDDGDTCSGVPGSPLQEENIDNPNLYTLFGVTSFCGTHKYPGVYIRVSKYIQWIEEVVWSKD